MVENYLLATKTIEKKLSKDHPMYPFMVCSLYGLLQKYNKNKELVIDLINKTDIIIEPGTVEEILERHSIEQDTTNPIHDDEASHIDTKGASNQGHTFVTDDNGEIYYKRERPFIICSTNNTNMSCLLNTFCHEMGHLIKGEQSSAYNYQDNGYNVFVIRTGLAHYVYAYNGDYTELTFSPNYSILDEAINCIQTTDIMQEILSLKEIIEDEHILKFLQSLDQDFLGEDHGYEDICLLVRELWKRDSFKSIIEDNLVLGNIELVIDEYDKIMGKGQFDRMSERLDDIFNLPSDVSDDIFNFYIDSYIDITKEYKERVKEQVK